MNKDNVRMREIKLRNPALKELLNKFVEEFFEDDMDFVDKHIKNHDSDIHCTSDEYLQRMQTKNHIGFPEHSMLVGTCPSGWTGHQDLLSENKRVMLVDMQKKINEFIGAKYNALCAYYPKGGHIGWHTNWNAPGYNILFTYNTTPNGYFKYQDPATKETHILKDTGSAWNIRVGYYGRMDEPDKILWHTAETESPRVNIAFVMDQEEMWLDMIDEIEDPEL